MLAELLSSLGDHGIEAAQVGGIRDERGERRLVIDQQQPRPRHRLLSVLPRTRDADAHQLSRRVKRMKRVFNLITNLCPSLARCFLSLRGRLRMFGSLIRRKQAARPLGGDDVAFESTTFSLCTAVPRPSERRDDERLMAMLRVAKLTDEPDGEQLIRVSATSRPAA